MPVRTSPRSLDEVSSFSPVAVSHEPQSLASLAAEAPDLPQLSVGDPLTGIFCLLRKEAGQTRQQKPYLSLTLLNGRRQSIDARVWAEQVPVWRTIAPGAVVRVTGELEAGFPEGAPAQLRVKSVEPQPLPHPLQDLMHAVYPGDVAVLERRFHDLVSRIEHPGIRRFVERFFETGVPWARFRTCPAAKGHHHAYLHGLLEHSIEVTEIALAISSQPEMRPHINRDIIIAGGLIHDAGKTHEYEWEGVPIGMSAIAGLTNHIGVGVQLTMRVHDRHLDELDRLGFTAMHRHHLEHIILSHHGKREWGALIEPQTPSALAIHQADMTSAHLRERFEKLRTGVLDAHGRVMGWGKYGLQTDPDGWMAPQPAMSHDGMSADAVLDQGLRNHPAGPEGTRDAATALRVAPIGVPLQTSGESSRTDTLQPALSGGTPAEGDPGAAAWSMRAELSAGVFQGSLGDLMSAQAARRARPAKLSERPGGKRGSLSTPRETRDDG